MSVRVQSGVFSLRDTGPPNDSGTYTTLVILHGFGWHGDTFSRLIPLSSRYNSRIVLVNRRDYPDAIPLDEDEARLLASAVPTNPQAAENLNEYMKHRARELYDFLEGFVKTENIPPPAGQQGGLVLAGWSFGTTWITALLTHISSFTTRETKLHDYLWRVVAYDPPYHALGYPPPSDSYNPLNHPSLAPGEGAKLFPAWVSGYYQHGNSPSELEHHNPLPEPRPTILTMSEKDIASSFYPPPASPGGSDDILMAAGIRHGLYATLRKGALYLPPLDSAEKSSRDYLRNIEVRYLWCDHSVWEMPWGVWGLKDELQEARKSGRQTRSINFIRLRGANHFAHWDQPERTLQALLSEVGTDVNDS